MVSWLVSSNPYPKLVQVLSKLIQSRHHSKQAKYSTAAYSRYRHYRLSTKHIPVGTRMTLLAALAYGISYLSA